MRDQTRSYCTTVLRHTSGLALHRRQNASYSCALLSSLCPLSLDYTRISTHRCNKLHVHWIEESETVDQTTSHIPCQWHVGQAGRLVHTLQVELHTVCVHTREERERERERERE